MPEKRGRLTALSSAGEEDVVASNSPAVRSPAPQLYREYGYGLSSVRRDHPMAKKKGPVAPVGKGPSSLFFFSERHIVRRITKFIIDWPYPFIIFY
ncbi:hypothetical protein JTE90_009232 [Oedothorax gibbosus]|uniref:Uncharacterized protein n=1 Tax=Oedothorax gibbosus TaxID=931172 RepID=A0AAV6US42_9ARAC|nr:hypothetical protein JTE90_009232 [Oedothorax gibbosus]